MSREDLEDLMTPKEYVAFTVAGSFYRGHGQQDHVEVNYLALGIAGESGEFADEVKKVVREAYPDQELPRRKPKLLDELSDVMWYVARICAAFDVTLEELMLYNTYKLVERHGLEWPYNTLSSDDASKLMRHIESRITAASADTSTDTDT